MEGHLKFLVVIGLACAVIVGVMGYRACSRLSHKKPERRQWALLPVDEHRAVVFEYADDLEGEQKRRHYISLVDMRRGTVWSRELAGAPYWQGANHCTSVGQQVISVRVKTKRQQLVVGYHLVGGVKLWESERLAAEDADGRQLDPPIGLCSLGGATTTYEVFTGAKRKVLHVLAIDRRTGRTLWRRTIGGQFLVAGRGTTLLGDRLILQQLGVGKMALGKWTHLSIVDGRVLHTQRVGFTWTPCLAFDQAWSLKNGRELSATDLRTGKTRVVTPRFGAGASQQGRPLHFDIYTCAEAAGKLVVIARNFSGTEQDLQRQEYAILALDPHTGVLTWTLTLQGLSNFQLMSTVAGSSSRRFEVWTGKLARYVPLVLHDRKRGRLGYRLALIDVHTGRQVRLGPYNGELAGYVPIRHGSHTLLFRQSSELALLDSSTGALVRAVRSRWSHFDNLRTHHIHGRTLWLWNDNGIMVLDTDTLKVRHRRGLWPPLEDTTTAQRKRLGLPAAVAKP